MHWLDTLAEIRTRKLHLARLDPRGGMPVKPPAGAAERAIAAVDRKLGRPLPPTYRAFLAEHDGWPQFFQRASLLGVHHLSRGSFVQVARLTVDMSESAGEPALDLVPFGIDPEGETVFAWNLASPCGERDEGELEVVLWANGIGERFASFPAFLEFVLAMLDAEVAERVPGESPRPVPVAVTPRARPGFAPLVPFADAFARHRGAA